MFLRADKPRERLGTSLADAVKTANLFQEHPLISVDMAGQNATQTQPQTNVFCGHLVNVQSCGAMRDCLGYSENSVAYLPSIKHNLPLAFKVLKMHPEMEGCELSKLMCFAP